MHSVSGVALELNKEIKAHSWTGTWSLVSISVLELVTLSSVGYYCMITHWNWDFGWDSYHGYAFASILQMIMRKSPAVFSNPTGLVNQWSRGLAGFLIAPPQSDSIVFFFPQWSDSIGLMLIIGLASWADCLIYFDFSTDQNCRWQPSLHWNWISSLILFKEIVLGSSRFVFSWILFYFLFYYHNMRF